VGISSFSDQVAALRQDPKYSGMDTVPLILVKDLSANLTIIRQFLLAQQIQAIHQMPLLADPASKRPRYHV
jgi:hypothetical protein